MRPIRIATRPSKLALAQAELVRKLLQDASAAEVSLVKVSTKGDRDRSDFLYKSNSKGLFTSEVERALLERRADLAVHSFKDLPTVGEQRLFIAAVPKREAVADALVASAQVANLADLPAGATVGTSSLRRIAQIHHLRDDLKCVALRGNVETRVSKVASGTVDAAIVACAGLSRLGLTDRISAILPPHEFLPAAAQGALAVQCRTDDVELAELVAQLDDKHSRITAEAERHVLACAHGGCSIPLGVYSDIHHDRITIDAMICDLEGRKHVKRSTTDHIDRARICAAQLAQDLLNAGGREILDQIRSTGDDGLRGEKKF